MWQRGVFLLLYKINYNVFELHYSLQKEPELQKRAKNAVKRDAKTRTKSSVEEWINVILLIPYYKVFQGSASASTSNLVSFFFDFKFFDFFSLNWIFSLNYAIMESNTLLLNAFLASLSIKFPQNCSLDQPESHKRGLFHQKSTCEMAPLSPFLSVLFYLIFSLRFLYFQN